ncbi:MAG: hypothetical protein WD275_03265 [Rhodothermales bacterium]
MKPGRTITFLLLALLHLGCGSRKEFRASELELERRSWDSVYVDVSFERREVIGGARSVSADEVLVMAFDEEYNTIYSGSAGLVTIPDQLLGDQEKITLEACGEVKSRQICVQKVVFASPKRLKMTADLDYPQGDDFARGRFDFQFRAERERFDGTGWERISSPDVGGRLVAHVDGDEPRERGAVSIPFSRSEGSFDFSRDPNYRNFKYYLESALLDHQAASIRFEVHAGLGQKTELIASVEKDVHLKTRSERAEDVRYLVEQALEVIIDELGSFLGARQAIAYVEEWTYDKRSRGYRVNMEAEWEGPLFDRGHYEIEGTLEVREDGSGALFRITSGNSRARRRWRHRTEADVIQLGKLDAGDARYSSSRSSSSSSRSSTSPSTTILSALMTGLKMYSPLVPARTNEREASKSTVSTTSLSAVIVKDGKSTLIPVSEPLGTFNVSSEPFSKTMVASSSIRIRSWL